MNCKFCLFNFTASFCDFNYRREITERAILFTGISEDWTCLLCMEVKHCTIPKESQASKRKNPVGLSGRDLLLCERILLELLCHDRSPPFHDPVPNYYKMITKPMDFRTIKQKLNPSHFNHYEDLDEFVSDIRLIFKNCIMFNEKGSELYKAAKIVEIKFRELLSKYFPEITYKWSLEILEQEGIPVAKELPDSGGEDNNTVTETTKPKTKKRKNSSDEKSS